MRVTHYGHAAITCDHDGQRLAIDPGNMADAAGALAGASLVLLTHDHPDHVDHKVLAAYLTDHPGTQVWGLAPVVETLCAQLPVPGVPADPRSPSGVPGSPRTEHSQAADSWGGSEAGAAVGPGGAASAVHTVAPGDSFTAGPFRVRVGGTMHALIHSSIPQIPNATYLVTGPSSGTVPGKTTASVYHPGDSFDIPEPSDIPEPGGTMQPGGTAQPDAGVDVLCVPISGPWMKLGEAMDFAMATPARYVVPIHEGLLSTVGRHMMPSRFTPLLPDGAYRDLGPGESVEV
jgi:L-ascorbate metabolism protein UlaG (beta-lactamase superfamily)